ncbi:ParB/RepB/Spo0J family partition protein [bacterium]|nr:ParB/RepB/Spo0J family partition protein [bacterium]
MFGQKLAIQDVNVSKITGSFFQMRVEIDYDMSEMIESIKENGILNPLMLKKIGSEYHVIAGHRRLKAARQIGLDTVPAVVYDKIPDKEAALKGMVDNLNRRELTPLEQAIGYKKLIEEFRFTQSELAKALGKSQSIISEYIRTLELLPPQVLKAVISAVLTFAHARVLLRLSSEEEMIAVFEKVMREHMSVDELKFFVTRHKRTEHISDRQLELEQISKVFETTSQIDKTLSNYWNKEILLKRSRIGDRLQVDFRNGKDLVVKLEKLLSVLKENSAKLK